MTGKLRLTHSDYKPHSTYKIHSSYKVKSDDKPSVDYKIKKHRLIHIPPHTLWNRLQYVHSKLLSQRGKH